MRVGDEKTRNKGYYEYDALHVANEWIVQSIKGRNRKEEKLWGSIGRGKKNTGLTALSAHLDASGGGLRGTLRPTWELSPI